MSGYSFVQKYLYDLLHFVFPRNCFEELIVNFNVFHPTCPKIVLSRVLGVGITSASMILFVPQILKIFNAKNAKGISIISQLLAFVAAVGTASYSFNQGFVFSQYGDSFFIAIQLMIIVMQILYYSDSSAYAFAFFRFLDFLLFFLIHILVAMNSADFSWASLFAVIGNYIPTGILTMLQASAIPIIVISKSIQVFRNYKDRSTGQLSLVSASMQLAGTIARVFTSVQETGDGLLIISYVLSALLNAVLFVQFFLYWSDAKRKKIR
ncbi:hypothetical protein KIN20_022164 [Parelaphostrongylus tenuis]|uniref:Mannose-P-dolichol utilization defect 1 protein homolog n=1 Tax=Parelaphostrongylus tenuis TaxID=148309 RepID=A0AAD5QS22_PARTN|nr:hypothetical protein KIN20_022164 [Parelaphostrongylus tenuis]